MPITRNQALPSKYFKKEDFNPPRVLKIREIQIKEIEDSNGNVEKKGVLYFENEDSGIVLNGTRWEDCEKITGTVGQNDAELWAGHHIEAWLDPDVKFGNKKVGGIGIREPSVPQASDSEGAEQVENPF